MTKKQWKTLSAYEETFKEADAGYYRAIMKEDVDILQSVYEELGYNLSTRSCNRCVLTMLQILSNEYKNYKNKTNKKDGE